MRQVRLAVSIVVVLLAVTAPGLAGSRTPTHLHGDALGSKTGLRLLVANDPPFVVDVDSGRVTPVPGVPSVKGGVLWVVSVAGRRAVIAGAATGTDAQVYGVLDRGKRVALLGRGSRIVAADSGSVWIRGVRDTSGCTVRQVAVRRTRHSRAAGVSVWPGGRGRHTRVGGRSRTHYRPDHEPHGLQNARGHLGRGRRARRSRRTGRSVHSGRHGHGFAAADPMARDDRQCGDAGNRSARCLCGACIRICGALRRLGADHGDGHADASAGMPAILSPKFTSMQWTDDGRLVLLAERRDGEGTVVVWRPGQRRLALKTFPMPEPNTGSPSFAPIR